MYIYIYIYICYVWIQTYMNTYIHTCIYEHLHKHSHVITYTYIYTCIHIQIQCLHAYIWEHVIYIYILCYSHVLIRYRHIVHIHIYIHVTHWLYVISGCLYYRCLYYRPFTFSVPCLQVRWYIHTSGMYYIRVESTQWDCIIYYYILYFTNHSNQANNTTKSCNRQKPVAVNWGNHICIQI
jgi:hypothetical protein